MGYSSCSMQTLSCGVWDLVPWLGIKSGPPALGTLSHSHWTTREVPLGFLFLFSSSGKDKMLYQRHCLQGSTLLDLRQGHGNWQKRVCLGWEGWSNMTLALGNEGWIAAMILLTTLTWKPADLCFLSSVIPFSHLKVHFSYDFLSYLRSLYI